MTEPTPATPVPPPARARPALSDRLPFRLALIVVAALALLVPLELIGELTREREARRGEAVAGIHRGWGAAQNMVAPLLMVPVVDLAAASIDERGWVVVPATRAALTVELGAEPRARGIFGTVVYRAAVAGELAFAGLEADAPGFAGRRVLWDEALIVAPVTELRGLDGGAGIDLAGRRVPLVVRDAVAVPGLGTVRALVAPLGDGAIASGRLDLRLDFALRGSVDMRITALAREAVVRIRSAWPHPSFHGGLLPDERSISARGFDALWRSNLPHLPAMLDAATAALVEEATLGVGLVDPVPTYRMVERAQKYDLLLIAFTFLVFFLFETLWGARLHVVHYALVGGALCLFYLLLLSFAELVGFVPAYVAASALVVAQAALYGLSLLRSRERAAAFGALLAGAYAYFFVLLMLESHALVAGALALFAGLSALMYVTRRIDWGAPMRAV
ncbi:MAG: inner membrane CreD family protein [Alphaproteobacteria bacterium]|nr:inner membrane CreD family protein [Alphaproteobacteria bacterium]